MAGAGGDPRRDGWERLIVLFARRLGWTVEDILDCPVVSLLRLIRLLRRAELEEAMESRCVADWPCLGEAERRRVILREQEALAALAEPVPAPEDALADPAAREHARRIRQRIRETARA